MKSYNRIELVGRIGGDVEEKQTKDNKPYWVFDVATGGDKAKNIDPDWFSCTCWNEAIASMGLGKGSYVKVVGTMRVVKKKDDRYKLVGKASEELPLNPNKTYVNVRVENIHPVVEERSNFGTPVMSGSLG
jgi:single-stranded DNA-binding protein